MLSGTALRSLFRLDAVVTVLSGLFLLLVPNLLREWLQLGSLSLLWMRIIGAIWLAFGLWLVTKWSANYTKGAANFAVANLVPNSLIVALAAVFGRFGLGILGWVAMLGTAAFIGFVALQWWGVGRRLN